MMRRWLYFAGIFCAIGLVLLCIVLVTVYVSLRSPTMQQKILASIREPLASAGIEVKVGSLAVDILGGVELRGLDLQMKQSAIEADVKIETLSLAYAWWPLLRMRLEIREAYIDGLNIKATLTPGPAEPPPPADPQALNKLVEMIRKPPISIDLDKVEIKRANLDITIKQQGSQTTVQMNDWSLSSGVQLNPTKLGLWLEAHFPVKLSIRDQTGFRLDSRIVADPNMKISASNDGKNLTWTLHLLDTKLKVGTTKLADDQAGLKITLKSFDLLSSLRLEHDGPLEAKDLTPLDLALALSVGGSTDVSIQDFALKSGPSEVMASLSTDFKHGVELPADPKDWKSIEWNIEKHLKISKLRILQSGLEQVDASGASLRINGQAADGAGNLLAKIDAATLKFAGLKQRVALEVTSDLTLAAATNEAKISTVAKLAGLRALDSTVMLKNPPKGFQADIGALISTHRAWTSIHPSFKSLDLVGWPQTDVHAVIDTDTIDLSAGIATLLDREIDAKITASVKQTPPLTQALASFAALDIEAETTLQKRTIKGSAKLSLARLKHSALQKPIDVVQSLNLQGNMEDRLSAKIDGRTSLNGDALLTLSAAVNESSKKLLLNQQLKLTANTNKLSGLVAGMEALPKLGTITVQSDTRGSVNYPEDRLEQITDWSLKRFRIDATSKQSISQKASGALYQLKKPMTLSTVVELNRGRLGAKTSVTASQLVAKDLMAVGALSSNFELKVANIDTASDVEIKNQSKIDNATVLLPAAVGFRDFLQQITAGFHIHIANQKSLKVHSIKSSVNKGLIDFTGDGKVDLVSGNGGFKATLNGEMPAGRTVAGVQGSGGFSVPVSASMLDGKSVTVRAQPYFKKLNLSAKDFRLEQLEGRLDVHEELSFDSTGKIAFLYLESQNPFTRVDFENIDPYLSDLNGLRLKKLQFKHYEIGPLVQNFEIRQNLVLLNELKADVLAGSILGRMFIDLHPQRLQIGFLGRFSGLQPELLKAPNLRRNHADELSGRMSSTFDIKKRLATGRVDVTSIGRNQLLALIDTIDPEFKDPQMMNARRGLQLAYPRLVAVNMEQGSMDLTIGLSGAINNDITIRSIPLTPLINANAGDVLLQIEQFFNTGG